MCLQKLQGKKKLNFTAIESNLISELATTHLELLQGKHSPEVTNAKKQEMWQDITSKVNALGVCLRTETEVRNRWRNRSRGAKQKFTTVQKERSQTGGGPPPTQPSQAEENINCMRDTASFRGVPGGQETLIERPEDGIRAPSFWEKVKQRNHKTVFNTVVQKFERLNLATK
ncbi:myb-related transcription factor, partner of profilin-like [Mytilus edulis]|uniref:myb-related transcription factor, partner of profilin-like n=1 Tax=Mytilus edulis TaxID=6550 RepID=UPI0039EFA070